MLYSPQTGGFYDAAIHGANTPLDAVEISEAEHAALLAGQSAGKRIVADAAGRPVLADPPPPTPEQIAAQYTAAMQAHLDDTARTRGYDGILSAASYATSPHPRFGPEGVAFRDWRDAVWDAGYTILGDVQAGLRPVPTVEDLIAELPALVLPQ